MPGSSVGQGQNSQHYVLRRASHVSRKTLNKTQGWQKLLEVQAFERRKIKAWDWTRSENWLLKYWSQISSGGSFSHSSLPPIAHLWDPGPSIRAHQQHPSSKILYHILRSPRTSPFLVVYLHIDWLILFLRLYYFIYKDIGVEEPDNGVRKKAILGCAEPHRSALSRTKCRRGCKEAASGLMTMLVILSSKEWAYARGAFRRRRKWEWNSMEGDKKSSRGCWSKEFWVWPPQDPTSLRSGVSLLHPNSPGSQSVGRQPYLFPGPAQGRHLSLPADCFSDRKGSVKSGRKEERKKEKNNTHTKKKQMRERNLSSGKGLGLQEKAFQCFL